jgi:hypothetical protein
MQHDESVLLVLVRMKRHEDIDIVIANVHLLWGNVHDVRKSQLFLAIESALEFGWARSAHFDIIVAGDFNATPNSPAIRSVFGRPEGYFSVYPFVSDDAIATHWSPGGWTHIDHIFTTVYGIEPISYLELDNIENLQQTYAGIPAEHYPSDHLMLAGLFQLKKLAQYPPQRIGAVPTVAPVDPTKLQISRPVRNSGGLGLVLRGGAAAGTDVGKILET